MLARDISLAHLREAPWNPNSMAETMLTRLKHPMFQITSAQLEVVEEALERVMPTARREKGDSPNVRGTALYLLCKDYLRREGNL